MTKPTAWIRAMRLRTLPLSVSGIIAGTALAIHHGEFNLLIFLLAISTTLLFQILSNLANDLGDTLNGADNEHRVGPLRSVQSGIISIQEMKRAVLICSLIAALSAGFLILRSAENMSIQTLIIYIFLGLFAILAAITYTVGKKAYGYHGLGDIFVFIFFGGVSVLGVFGLYVPAITFQGVLWAIAIGGLSTAVLNLNNMRDIENDRNVGKRTLVVKMGFERAKFYHTFLLMIPFTALVTDIFMCGEFIQLVCLLPFILIFRNIRVVHTTTEPRNLDPELKKVALSTFFISVIYMITSLL